MLGLLVLVASIPGIAVTAWVTFYGFWPGTVLIAIVSDILSQGSTILSLVIYLSITRTLESQSSQ